MRELMSRLILLAQSGSGHSENKRRCEREQMPDSDASESRSLSEEVNAEGMEWARRGRSGQAGLLSNSDAPCHGYFGLSISQVGKMVRFLKISW